jgi:hypothetical protein
VRFIAMNRGQRGKLAMATAALGVGLLSLTGCGYTNAQQTTQQYSASDGTHTELGALELRNMLILATGEDQPGRLTGAVYNDSSEDVTLTLTGSGGSEAEISVPKNSYTLLTNETEPVILQTAGAEPGALVEMDVKEDGTNQTAKFKVPVLDATLEEYAEYLPEGSQPTETASPTETGSASPTAEAEH